MPGALNRFDVITSAGGTNLPSAGTETVIATTNGVSTFGPSDLVIIEWTATITQGSTPTSIQFRVRRGTTTSGTQVWASGALTSRANLVDSYGGQATDVPGEVAMQPYCLTCAAAASANGTSGAIVMWCQY
jgi:hypothetical protein